MAGLVIKVSEEKYKDTIDQLGKKITKLEDSLQKLQGKRADIEREYTGLQGEAAAAVIKANEANVRKAIDDVKDKKEKLQKYLDSMISTDAAIKKKYDEAKRKADSVFG